MSVFIGGLTCIFYTSKRGENANGCKIIQYGIHIFAGYNIDIITQSLQT